MAPPPTTSRPGRLLVPASWHSRFKVGLGLDLSSGTTVTLKAIAPKGTSPSALQSDMNTAVSVMNSRVNGAGFNGATVVPQGTSLINVTVPGKQSQQVVNLVGTTAQLRFRQVLLVAPNYSTSTPTPTPTPTPSASPTPTPSKSSPPRSTPSTIVNSPAWWSNMPMIQDFCAPWLALPHGSLLASFSKAPAYH